MKSSDYPGLEELATICAMCNDSSVDYNEVCFIVVLIDLPATLHTCISQLFMMIHSLFKKYIDFYNTLDFFFFFVALKICFLLSPTNLMH